ncbi:CARDB domain-containing protein [Roseobacter weihaiensis]|uniref:CARDB domain-containing protein n=1 Tax=Roseobacter weihaiensis TaxID=2763262 RepID=UPI001D0ACCDE|nr:CARDB domain-containing protein [Roseobacter sp. H9]
MQRNDFFLLPLKAVPLKSWLLNTSAFTVLACLVLAAGGARPAQAATVDCQADRSGTEMVLYLYFPSAEDSDFPASISFNGNNVTTGPIPPFDASDLDDTVGTTAQYRDAIAERVRDDYCEFNVQVVQSTSASGTTNPTPTDDRWHVVGIASDGFPTGNLYGLCCAGSGSARTSRVWAGEFGDESQPGGAIEDTLTGTGSTLARWANAIAGTTSHEAGHSFGVGHADSVSRPTEDARNNHILASGAGNGNITGEDRASDRHFSDTSYEVLANSIGLFQQTLSNWDFINPNDSAADGLQITILVAQGGDAPMIASVYDGGLSPWRDAALSANGTGTFQGEAYDRYRVSFTDPQAWNNGDPGEIPAGAEFHVGVGLTRNYIVRDVTLLDSGGAMTLHPRVVGYTPEGSFDPATGEYHLTMSVPDPDNGPLLVSDVSILHLPRTVTINEMRDSGALLGDDGRSIQPWDSRVGPDITVASASDLGVANLAQPRAVDFQRVPDPDCPPFPVPQPVPDSDFVDLRYCEEGPVLGLFPSARVYVAATVTDPNARYFDRTTGTMVTGPLSNRIFIQFPGGKPDLNENGVDDAIDIDTGICDDANGNGVCDSAEPTRYRYGAKLVCGTQPSAPSDGRLVKAHYATTINVLNVSDKAARIRKSLALSYPPKEQKQGDVYPIAVDALAPGHALKTDCADIEARLFPGGFPTPYIEGYVTLEAIVPLDVTGVYTSRALEQAPACHGGGGDGCKKSCTEDPHHGCPAGPSVSTTLDVVPIKEHIIDRKAPPVPLCSDLTVGGLSTPRVRCPEGAGSCVTQLDYTVANIGVAASGPFEAVATLDPQQSVTVLESLSSLLPGQSRTVSVVTPPGGNCFDPDCTVRVVVDPANGIAECREDNNTATATTGG